MKKALSLCLLTLISCSTVLPTLAQKNVRPFPSKITINDAATQFANARAFSDGEGVFVEWEMNLEVNNGGFYVYRIDESGTNLVSPGLVLGAATRFRAGPIRGEKYSFFDADGDARAAYVIKSVNMDGTTKTTEPFVPVYLTDLKDVAGLTSREMSRRASENNGSIINSELTLSKSIANEIGLNRIAADINTHRWVISQPGVKIGVRREGLFRVTKAELQAGGFNVNSDPNFWQLYVEGVQQAMIIGPNADYIEFYGRGIDTVESDTQIYFLVSGPEPGKRIQSRPARPAAGTVTSPNYRQTFVQKERTTYINQILNGDAENYWGGAIITVEPTVFNFNLSGVDFNSLESTMELKFQGYSFDPHIVQVILNGQTLPSATGNARSSFSRQYAIPTSFLREGSNRLEFRALGVFADFSFFDSISIAFARKHLAAQNRLNFFTQNYRISKIEGFSSQNIRVFDTTAESSPVLLTNLNVLQDGAAFGITLPAARGRLMFAVENSGLLQASSITVNDPALIGTPTNGADLVIISYKDWVMQAETWANYRRAQGITVKVVEVSEIYDEFNYGVLNADSIKSFLQYAVNNWQTVPKYVLFLGDSSYDSRNYEGHGFLNYMPTRIVNTLFTETGSDDFLADFNNDGLSELAVGRIAARSSQAVTNALAKVIAFEPLAATALDRGALFAYDQFDAVNGYDFQQISVRVRNQLPTSMPVMMVGRSDTPPAPATPQSLLVDAMNTGKFVVNYAGHGATGTWASASFFSIFTVPQLTNANNQSIFVMLTCLNGYFLNPTRVSLAETLVESTTGGAVAAWASTGETTPDIQEIMATRFYLKLGQGTIPKLGDLIRDAKTSIPGGGDVRLSWALIGDPMLKVRQPAIGD